MDLTLDQALTIAQTALREAAARKTAPLCVAVIDRGGHVLALLRDERASIYRGEIATAKAAGCLGMGFGGRELFRRAQAMLQFFTALAPIFHKGIVPFPGGVLIRDADGELIGAVGISGDTSDNDEQCACLGIEAVGLKADTGA